MRYRQGDVLLIKIDKIPENAKQMEDKILAYGEATGHSHRFSDDKNIERYQVGNELYLQVFTPTPLIHEEHHQQIILPGTYRQIQEREYDYVKESSQTAID